MSVTVPRQPAKAAMSPREFRDVIEAADITQEEAAKKLGVSRPTVVRWLAGTTPICTSKAKLISLVFRPKK